ncbi:MAG: hypothetical protein ACHQD9_07670, partial [Chitinophagales bacterium]
DAITNEQLWSENFQRKATDVFAVQSEIAERVAQELKTKLTAQEKKNIETAPTTNSLAYDYYLQAKNVFNSYDGPSGGQYDRGVQLLDKARQLDPHFIKATAFQATIYMRWHYYDNSIHRDIQLEKADSLISIMDAIAPDDPETKLAHAYYKANILNDYDGALEIYNSYIQTNSNNAEVFFNMGSIYESLLKLDEAATMMKRAVELDPKNCSYLGVLDDIYRVQRDAVNAVIIADKEMQLCPNEVQIAAFKAYALMDFNGDISAAQQLLHQSPLKDHPEVAENLRLQIFMLTGKIDSALLIVKTWPGDSIYSNTWINCQSFNMGYYLWLKGDTIQAKKYFAKAVNFMNKSIEKIPQNANPYMTYSAYSTLALSYAGLGNERECMQSFAMLDNLDIDKNDKLHMVDIMETKTTAYILLGKKEEAITNLQLLLEQPFKQMSTKVLYHLYPLYNSLRSDPRFQKMIQ